MRPVRGVTLAGVVFCAGIGVGLAWRLGWLPIEFLAPETGVVDELSPAADNGRDEPLPLPSGQLADSNPVSEPEEEQTHFEGLTEPPPLSAPLARPTVVTRGRTEPETPLAVPPNRLTPPPDAVPALANQTAPPSVRGASYQSVAEVPAAAPATTAAASSAPPALTEIDRHLEAGEILAAHKELSKIYWKEPGRREEIRARIEDTARRIFFAPQPHFIEPYVVQPGDRLETIASRYKLSWEYVSRLNQVAPQRIRAGQRLKVVRGPFGAVVELGDYSLTVHLQGYYVKRYPVGIGKDGATPVGKFAVLNKVVNPQYTDPDGRVIDGDDPQNPLGERWIDLGNSYGIHGTIDPASVGQAASRGCVRLRDTDVIEVYDFLIVGSEVVIRP